MATNWESIRTENFDDPTQYKPERWLDDDISTTHTLATVPFGYGPKACLARKLANLQLSMLISKVNKFSICTLISLKPILRSPRT